MPFLGFRECRMKTPLIMAAMALTLGCAASDDYYLHEPAGSASREWHGGNPEVRDENGDGYVDSVTYYRFGGPVTFFDHDHDQMFETVTGSPRELWPSERPLENPIPAFQFDTKRPPTKEELRRFDKQVARARLRRAGFIPPKDARRRDEPRPAVELPGLIACWCQAWRSRPPMRPSAAFRDAMLLVLAALVSNRCAAPSAETDGSRASRLIDVRDRVHDTLEAMNGYPARDLAAIEETSGVRDDGVLVSGQIAGMVELHRHELWRQSYDAVWNVEQDRYELRQYPDGPARYLASPLRTPLNTPP